MTAYFFEKSLFKGGHLRCSYFCNFFCRVSSGTIYWGFYLLIISSSFALSANPCIGNSLSIKHEKKTFADLVLKERNMIFINLIFNQSYTDEFVENRRLERWMWVANDYRYVLSYPEDVDVFSLGLLKAKHGSLEVKINIGNLSEICKRQFNFNLAQYLSKVVKNNATAMDYSFDTSAGYICHSKIGKDTFGENMYLKLSDISAVKLGFPFWCYTDNNTATIVEKSYVNYIVVVIIFFAYCFYPLAIESVFYVEDKKIVQGAYYMSESPYSPSVLCKRILFAGNNEYLATLRIISFVTVLTTVVYLIKSEVYDSCNCLLKSSNDDQSFQHAENIYINHTAFVFWGSLHFLQVNLCVLFNSDGDLDDFIILHLTNICNCGMFLKTVPVSTFLTNDENQRNQDKKQNHRKRRLVSNKIHKCFLLFSLSFWSKLFLINWEIRNNNCLCRIIVYIISVICFLINLVLVVSSTLCPLVSMVYIFCVKYLNVASGKLVCGKIFCCKENQTDDNAIKHETVAKYMTVQNDNMGNKDEDETVAKRYEQNDNKRNKDETVAKCIEGNESIEMEGIILEQDNAQNDNNENNGKHIKREIINVSKKEILKKKIVYPFIFEFVSHTFTVGYLISTYLFSFNIFFCGVSYVIQFFMFTLFLAVPHFSIQSYIYVIFITSVVIYISRFVFHFIKLYRCLLEKILEIQGQTSIPINHFDKVVAKYFPLSNEIFYLFVKIILSGLFFTIIYDTMKNVEYIRFGAHPDLTTIISLIFLFGPPRLVEALLTSDFTSRVHMKENEIKEELEKIKLETDTEELTTFKTMSITLPVLTKEEEKISCIKSLKQVLCKESENSTLTNSKSCKNCCRHCIAKVLCKKLDQNSEKSKALCCQYRPMCFWLRWVSMFCCGCCNFAFNGAGKCLCCDIMVTNSKSCEIQRSLCKIPCICVKECNDDNGENSEEETNLVDELKTNTLYKITVDTVDEIRPQAIYRVKAEILNDGEKNNVHKNGQQDASNKTDDCLTEQYSTNQNGFEETGLCVPTVQTTNGSNSLIYALEWPKIHWSGSLANHEGTLV